VALTMDAMRDRTLEAYLPGLTVPARAPGDLPTRDEAREMMGAQLETSAGSLRLWLGGTGRCEIQDWTRYLTFLAAPEAMPHGGMTMYRDTECGFSAALRLPVQ